MVLIHSGLVLNLKRERNSVTFNNMELENIMLSGIRQPQKDKSHMLSLIVESKTIEPLKQNGDCESWRWKAGVGVAKEYSLRRRRIVSSAAQG